MEQANGNAASQIGKWVELIIQWSEDYRWKDEMFFTESEYSKMAWNSNFAILQSSIPIIKFFLSAIIPNHTQTDAHYYS